MSRKCVSNPDNFCYICGEVTFASRKCSIIPTIKNEYFLYFGCKLGDQDKKWSPHVCCITCSSKLNAWVNGKGRCVPFGVLVVWRVPSNHSTDLFLYGAPCSKWYVHEETINTCVSEYTISNSPCASWRWTFCSWTSGQFYNVPWRRRQCFLKQRRTAAISFKRCRVLAKHRHLQS